MAVKRHGGRRLQVLSVDGAENPNVVIGPGGGPDDAVVLIDHLHELADHEGHGLDSFDLFLGA